MISAAARALRARCPRTVRPGAMLTAGLLAAALMAVGGAAAQPLSVRLPGRFSRPPTVEQCLRLLHLACYRPAQLHTAYDLGPLYAAGLDGRGRTIAIVDSFGSPTIGRDLRTFDRAFGLPDPALRVVAPAGRVPRFNPRNHVMDGWATETTLDVEYAHAMAPGARILLVETPVAETEGVTGFPPIVRAENAVIDRGAVDVISQSFGATEQTFPSRGVLLGLRGAFVSAARHRVTVLAGSGDNGAAGLERDGARLFPFPATSWPSSDPLVTSVGATRLALDARGNRLRADTVWNDSPAGGPSASGGGLSAVFGRPGYQAPVAAITGRHRGTPDLSVNGAGDSSVLIYVSFIPHNHGWMPAAGTSESVQLFAGIAAIADQAAGRRLGALNPALYRLGAHHAAGLPDITRGTNTIVLGRGRRRAVIRGYRARPGYDLASGLGTIDAARLVAELAAA